VPCWENTTSLSIVCHCLPELTYQQALFYSFVLLHILNIYIRTSRCLARTTNTTTRTKATRKGIRRKVIRGSNSMASSRRSSSLTRKNTTAGSQPNSRRMDSRRRSRINNPRTKAMINNNIPVTSSNILSKGMSFPTSS
jgi:hypothetical protein